MQDHGDPVLALDQHPRQLPGRGLRGGLDRGQEGLDPGVGDHPLAVPALHPVLADVGHAVEAQRVAQEPDRTPAHDRDETDSADETRERVARGREHGRGIRVVDDRCERAVEVDEHRGTGRVRDQRVERGVHERRRYEPRMTTQFAVSLPVGGGLGIASTFGAPSTDAATVVHSRS